MLIKFWPFGFCCGKENTGAFPSNPFWMTQHTEWLWYDTLASYDDASLIPTTVRVEVSHSSDVCRYITRIAWADHRSFLLFYEGMRGTFGMNTLAVYSSRSSRMLSLWSVAYCSKHARGFATTATKRGVSLSRIYTVLRVLQNAHDEYRDSEKACDYTHY
jgi:hypothetical protein